MNYLHIKFSHDGKTFSNDNGKEFAIWYGLYIDSNKEDSLNFEDYQWRENEFYVEFFKKNKEFVKLIIEEINRETNSNYYNTHYVTNAEVKVK